MQITEVFECHNNTVTGNHSPLYVRGLNINLYDNNHYDILTFKLQRTANEYAAKRRIYKRLDQQTYTLSNAPVNSNCAQRPLPGLLGAFAIFLLPRGRSLQTPGPTPSF